MFLNRAQRRHPEMYGITMYAPDNERGEGGGGSATGLLEREVAGETAGETEGETETEGEGGESEAEGEAEEGAEGAKAKGGKAKPKADADTEALVAAAKEEGQREAAREREAQDREAADAKAEADHKTKLANLYTTHETELTKTLDAIGVEIDDKVYRLDQGTRAEILKNLKDFNDLVVDAEALKARDAWTNNVVALLPEDKRDATRKELAKVTSYADFFRVAGEAYAPHAKGLDTLGLDDVLALSPKAKREHLEAVKKAKTDGRALGQDDPDAEPENGGESTKAKGDTKTRLVDPHTKPAELSEMLAQAGVH